MKLIDVKLGDGRVVKVDAHRHRSFDSLKSQLVAMFGSDGIVTAGDAGESMAFLVSQLAYTEQTAYEVKYQPMQYEQFVPLDFSAGEWATSIRWEIYDYAGRGRRLGNRSKDIAKVDVAYAQDDLAVVGGGIGYDYNMEELRQAAFLRKPVDSTKIAAAIDGYRRHMNDVALFGEADSGFEGLFTSTAVNAASATTGSWDDPATPAEILADINEMLNAVWTNTNFTELPTDVLIAPTAFADIATRARSDNSDKTILQYVKENNIVTVQTGRQLNFAPGYGLDTAGSGSTKRMMAYVKSPQHLRMHIPMPLRFLAPQLSGLMVEVPGEYKYSGCAWRYPGSAEYRDGI